MKKLSLFLVALTMILFSCKPEVEKPTVVTKSVGEVTKTSAKVVGQVAADGGADVTERGVCWSTDGTPTILDFSVKDTECGLGSYEISFTDLVPNTQYYVRAYATNEAGTGYGDEKTFTTLGDDPEEPGDEPEEPGDDPEQPENPENPEQPEEPENPIEPEQPVGPVVITAEVTEITLNSAVSGGEVVSGGDAVVIARGICYNTTGAPTVSDTYTMDGNGMGVYASYMTDLQLGTTYYVRAYATDVKGITSYGEEVTFTTLEKLLPTVVTGEVTEIKFFSATCGGEVTFNGNVSVTARGICWSTSPNPTIEDNKTNNGSGVGSYTYNMTNLEHNTTYYVRAYATNEVGTAYGEERTFKTLAVYSPATGTSNGYGYVVNKDPKYPNASKNLVYLMHTKQAVQLLCNSDTFIPLIPEEMLDEFTFENVHMKEKAYALDYAVARNFVGISSRNDSAINYLYEESTIDISGRSVRIWRYAAYRGLLLPTAG